MKRMLPTLLLLLLLSSAPANASESLFRVEGMKAEACARNVREAVLGLEGVTEVAVDRVAGVVRVRHSGKVSDDAVIAQINAGKPNHPPHVATAISKSEAEALQARAPKPAPTAANAPLKPWEPIDETFRGCEGGCGLRGEDPKAVIQPGASIGQTAYCPVSGVAFQVTPSTHKAEVNGKPVYFCCEGCARHFAAAKDEVAAKRSWK
jgi:copper chaperone CopZ/YHS domain-containing protein